MDNRKNDWDEEWAGLEPKQNASRYFGCWFGFILLSIILLAICAAGAYLAWQRLDLLSQPGQFLGPPTAVSGSEMTAEAADPSLSETPSIAPTVTLPAANLNGNIETGQLNFVPLIDGDLEEWSGNSAVESLYRVYNVPDWDGTDDLNAVWRLGWDDVNLYVSVNVADDTHVQTQTGNQIFKGDGVSLQIDSNRESDLGTELNEDDFQINLSPGDFAGIPPSAYRFRGSGGGQAVDAPGHNVVVAAQKTEAGYALETAIPWQDLDITPSPGLVIGLALNANDNDTPGTAEQEVMKSHIGTRTFRDPSSWGTLTLR